MKSVPFCYQCGLLLFSYCCLIKSGQAHIVYKVGNLFPESDYHSFNSNQTSSISESSISRAINFAGNALNELFLNVHNCHFDLKPSNTKVKFKKTKFNFKTN